MQGQRCAIGCLPESLAFEQGSASSDVEQQICWNNIRSPLSNRLSEYISSPNTSTAYQNSMNQEGQNINIWSIGEASSSSAPNQVSQSHVETKTEHGWPPQMKAYPEPPASMLSLGDVNMNAIHNNANHWVMSLDLKEVVDSPGGRVKFTPKLNISNASEERVPCFRVLNDSGQISKELAVKMYTDMVTLQVMDTIFYEAQRQGRISFYLTTIGEEAINIASSAALNNKDFVFPQVTLHLQTNKIFVFSLSFRFCFNFKRVLASARQSFLQALALFGRSLRNKRDRDTDLATKYREPGVLLWRGFTLLDFANQCFGNKYDNGKGRQGSNKLNYFTVTSTVATQIPHAVGAAYSLKMEKQDACTVTYFGDGGSSTGDFHAALNFAAVMEVPVIFFCRNNGWAISTPISDQFRSDGIVVRGKAYGVPSIRVDKRVCYIFSLPKKLPPKVYLALNKPKGYICSSGGSQTKSVLSLFNDYMKTWVTG